MTNGRASALADTTGLVYMIVDPATDEFLGEHVVGPLACKLVSEAATSMAFKASNEDIARICFAYPTLSETFKEASLAAD
ncbi:hypothetical protein [Pseudomonas sp. CFSAN084952]|uniref:hypothetical protein n=1 Tax=Pseudomonas TaxID=286 RepID=UPI00211577E1|nr:hypothetical protein [Pseudomonas sp. CFSAN084952]